MDQFISNQNQTLLLDLQGRGITFHYAAGRSDFHVGHSWGSIHALLAKLRNCRAASTSRNSPRMPGCWADSPPPSVFTGSSPPRTAVASRAIAPPSACRYSVVTSVTGTTPESIRSPSTWPGTGRSWSRA